MVRAPSPLLEPADVQLALDTALGFHTEHLTTQVARADKDQYRNFVVFKVGGVDYCRAHAPGSSASDCAFRVGDLDIPWEAENRVGVAVVTFSADTIPKLQAFRFFSDSNELWRGDPKWEQAAKPEFNPNKMYYEFLDIESALVDDVDGDQQDELVLRFGAYQLVPSEALDIESTSPGELYVWSHLKSRLVVVREDLSLKFDAYVHHEFMAGSAPGWAAGTDVLHERYEFVPAQGDRAAALVFDWCEVDALLSYQVEACVLAALCKEPTQRVVVGYDARTDSFSLVERNPLRPTIKSSDGVECAETARQGR